MMPLVVLHPSVLTSQRLPIYHHITHPPRIQAVQPPVRQLPTLPSNASPFIKSNVVDVPAPSFFLFNACSDQISQWILRWTRWSTARYLFYFCPSSWSSSRSMFMCAWWRYACCLIMQMCLFVIFDCVLAVRPHRAERAKARNCRKRGSLRIRNRNGSRTNIRFTDRSNRATTTWLHTWRCHALPLHLVGH